MAENFLDNIIYANSTLGVSGDAIAIGSTNAGAKSVIFNTSNTAGHLAWLPTANRTLNLPDGSGTLMTNVNLSAGTTSNNLSAMVFSNANGVSFGLNGSTITASVQAGAAAGIGAVGAGTQTQTSGTLIFSNSNGMTFGMSNSSVITGSYTVPTQTNQTLGLFATSNTTQNSSTTLDARSLTIQGAGIASIGYSNGSIIVSVPSGAPSPVNFSAGTTSGNLGSVVFSNANGVSFGLNGSTITASAAGGGGGVNTYFATGNTTQNSTTTLNQSSLLFNALGGMTMGFSNGSIQVSVPPATSVVGLGGIILSTNGSTLTISGPNLTNFEQFPLTSTTSFAPGAGSWYFQPVQIPANISGGRVNRLFSMGANASNGVLGATASASFSSASTGSRSISCLYVNSIALYTLGSGTNSTRLESIWSNSFSLGINQSVSVSSGGATTLSITNAATISYIASIDANGAYTTASATGSSTRTTAAASMASASMTAGLSNLINILSGQVVMPIGFNTTVTPGNYWFAQCWNMSSTTGGTIGTAFTQVNQVALSVPTELGSVYRIWGQTVTNANSQIEPGHGIFSTTSASPPSTIAFSQIGSIGSGLIHYMNWVNSTI